MYIGNMKTLLPFLSVLFLFSCGQPQSDTSKSPAAVNDTAKASAPVNDLAGIFLDTVHSISKRSTEITFKEVEEQLHEYFSGIEMKVIPQRSVTEKLNIYGVTFIGELPGSLHTAYTFLDVKDKHLQFLLPVEFNQVYELENRIMIGGIFSSREYEYYSIYELDSVVLKRIFDTSRQGEQRMVIGYFKDDACIDYMPDRLLYEYNEQTHEILFTGDAAMYCDAGKDRVKNDTIKEFKRVKLLFHCKKGKWELDKSKSRYFTW